MRKVTRIAFASAALTLGGIASASAATSQMAPHYAKKAHVACRAGYRAETWKHIVGKRPHRHIARYEVCVLNPKPPTRSPSSSTAPSNGSPSSASTSTSTTTAPSPPPSPGGNSGNGGSFAGSGGSSGASSPPVTTYSYQARLDPSFTQSATNPKDVTFTYSADATETITPTGGTVTTTDTASTGTLPDGILNFYNDGSLACSFNVGGSVTGSTCDVSYSSYGHHTVVTEYLPGSVSPVSETDVEDIEPFTPTLSMLTATAGAEQVDSQGNYAVTMSIPVEVTSQGSPTGTVTMSDGTHQATCPALSGGSATCTIYLEQSAGGFTYSPTVSYSGDSNDAAGELTGTAVTVPAAPAPVDTTVSTSVSDVQLVAVPNDTGYYDPSALVSGLPDTSTGTVTFTWQAYSDAVVGDYQNESCVASIVSSSGSGDTFECSTPISNGNFTPPWGQSSNTITVTYSGETQTTGDSAVTTYSASSGTGTHS